MNRLNTRINKLEMQSQPVDAVDAITYSFFAPSSEGPKRTGAMTIFLGVDLPKMHQGAHQAADEYDACVDELRERIRILKTLPAAEKQTGLDAISIEINRANAPKYKS
ncbi:hypothetical protein [Roseobacter sp.]|uniref:hypothetical protein n=1 Tax=Roseobacter sp. TaxID=1907202 RepID=UPI00385A336D